MLQHLPQRRADASAARVLQRVRRPDKPSRLRMARPANDNSPPLFVPAGLFVAAACLLLLAGAAVQSVTGILFN